MKQQPKRRYGTIPEPTNDVYGLYRTVLAMKHILDKMMGVDTEEQAKNPTGEARKPSVFVQEKLPENPMEGDLWLSKQPNSLTFNVYANGDWRIIWQ